MQKSKKDLPFPEDEPCRNCGVHLEDRYCPHCGQDRLAGARRSFGRMVMDIGSGVFAFDAKTWVTIRRLLLHPGFLSKEYVSGRVSPYTAPVKLFWMMVLIYAISCSLRNTIPLISTTDDAGCQQETEVIQNETVFSENVISIEEIIPIEVEEVISTNEMEEEEAINQGMPSEVIQYLPYFMLIMIMFYTALLMLFFRREKYVFSEHLVFAVHLNTFYFFMFTILKLAALVTSYLLINDYINSLTHDYIQVFASLTLCLTFCLYSLWAAIKFYYMRKKRSVIWRMALIGVLYLIVTITLAAILMVLIH